ncbi:phage tail protein [Ewingella americana]|uniref:phage tail protein n=1 Tax=Ewingella americana TaxID=41202 RepID=UPI001F3354E4|nr:phage tail protein [Ewingella americana]
MSKFKSVVTTLGQTRIAAAIESGKDINISHMAVGDGNGAPTEPSVEQTALVHETYRLLLNSIKVDNKNANWIIAEAIIPASVGGFWMREMGLFSDQGELIAVSNMADSYKPTLEEGSGRTQTLRMVITVTDTEAVSLTIDDTLIIATEEYVNNLLAEHEASRRHPDGTLTDKGFVQLNSAVDSNSETLAATPKAVKAANDNANGRLPSGGTAVAANKLATARNIAGVAFDGTTDISLTAANVGALPTGGTAVAANKLATPKNISGVPFDGTTDINLSPYNVGAVPASGGDVGYLNNALHYATKSGSWEGAGAFAGQYLNNTAPFMVPAGLSAPLNASQYHPIVKGIVNTQEVNYGAAISFGALTSGGSQFPSGVIHIIGDSGLSQAWSFNVSDGTFNSPGNILAGGGVYESSGGVRVWSPNNRPSPLDINAIAADTCSYAGFAAGNAQQPYMRNSNSGEVVNLARQDWVYGNFVNSVRLAGRAIIGDTGGRVDLPNGCVYTGMSGANYYPPNWGAYSAIQILVNGNWFTIGTV